MFNRDGLLARLLQTNVWQGEPQIARTVLPSLIYVQQGAVTDEVSVEAIKSNTRRHISSDPRGCVITA